MLEYALFFAGIVFLVQGANYIVKASSAMAVKLHISTLIIGITVVAFGTSLPELVINVVAAMKGTTDVALGNIVGSNISNILLVLGITSVIFPLAVKRDTIWKDIPLSLIASLILLIVANDVFLEGKGFMVISRIEGLLMLVLLGTFMYYIFQTAMKSRSQLKLLDKKILSDHEGWFTIAAKMIGGLAAVIIGGQWVVDGVIVASRQLGIGEFVIATTVVALGTSLPEVVTSIVAALKGDPDLSVGNIVGSNIYNVLLILALTAVITPIPIATYINLDLLFLIFINILLLAFVVFDKKHKLNQWQGVSFIILYLCYVGFVFYRGIIL